MNIIQKLLAAFMSLVIMGMILFPQWIIKWTVRLDYRYYYEVDARNWAAQLGRTPPPDLLLSGTETESRVELGRAFLFTGPGRPICPIPPPKTEQTGTGSVNLGARRTIYTKATATDFAAHLNVPKLTWEVTVLLIPFALFMFMFRDTLKTPKMRLIDPEDQVPPAAGPKSEAGPQGKSDGHTP